MASMTYPAGDQIPITRTFVQGTATTAIPLVGQVLNNGKTNWVGYDEGSAFYILPSSTADAEPTTLADGSTYYVSEGKAPAGYLATAGGAGASSSAGSAITTSASRASQSSASSQSDASESTRATTTHGSSSMTDAAASPTTSGAAGRVSTGGVVSLVLGVMAWFI